MEASWTRLGASWAQDGKIIPTWGPLGGLLDASWRPLGAFPGARGAELGENNGRTARPATLFLAHSKAPGHEKRRRVGQNCLADGVWFPWGPLINRFHRFRSRRKGPGHASRSSAVADCMFQPRDHGETIPRAGTPPGSYSQPESLERCCCWSQGGKKTMKKYNFLVSG